MDPNSQTARQNPPNPQNNQHSYDALGQEQKPVKTHVPENQYADVPDQKEKNFPKSEPILSKEEKRGGCKVLILGGVLLLLVIIVFIYYIFIYQ